MRSLGGENDVNFDRLFDEKRAEFVKSEKSFTKKIFSL